MENRDAMRLGDMPEWVVKCIWYASETLSELQGSADMHASKQTMLSSEQVYELSQLYDTQGHHLARFEYAYPGALPHMLFMYGVIRPVDDLQWSWTIYRQPRGCGWIDVSAVERTGAATL